MAKVKGRTDGLIPGAIDRCKFFPKTMSFDPSLAPNYLEKRNTPRGTDLFLFFGK